MNYIYEKIIACRQCNLWSNVEHKVIASGPFNSKYFVFGQCAGREEYEQYEPFIGKSGILLRDCLEMSYINLKEVYFSNVCRCWPHTGKYPEATKNCDPEKTHIKACCNYVYAEIDFIRPQVIIPTGNIPLSILVNNAPGITKCHGQIYETIINGVSYPVVPIYHPSYLIRTEDMNTAKYDNLYREYLEDMETISRIVNKIQEPKVNPMTKKW